MKIGLQTWGSDGDIRPFLALAGGLSAAGHEVSLIVTSADGKEYSLFGDKMGFTVVHAGTLSSDEEELRQIKKKLLTARIPLLQVYIMLHNLFNPVIPEMFEAAEQLCRENDLIIGHFIHYPVQAAAEKANKPYITVTLNHGLIYSKHTKVLGAPAQIKWLYPLSWKIASFLMDCALAPDVNRLRKLAGLSPVKDIISTVMASNKLNLIAESAAIGTPQPDWPDYHQVCGVFSMPDSAEEWSMPTDLKLFIESGSPPIFITLGSMLSLESSSAAITSLLVQAALQSGCRAIIQSRWDEITDFPDHENIYRIGSIPHQHIFPFCSAVVHHGGAGTTHSATLHGCPSIVIEHFIDQEFFAKELKRLGIAPNVLHRRNVTANKLATAIRATVDSPCMKKKAEELGAIMQKENGVKKAVALIEDRFACLEEKRRFN